MDAAGKSHDQLTTAALPAPSELEDSLFTFMTFTAVILTVASAFLFGIFSGYLAIFALLRLMDRRSAAVPAPVRVQAHAASSGD